MPLASQLVGTFLFVEFLFFVPLYYAGIILSSCVEFVAFLTAFGLVVANGQKGVEQECSFWIKATNFSVTIRTIHWLIMLFLEQSNKL